MRIIETYILKSILRNFCLMFLIFTLLFILIDSTSKLDEFIEHQVPFHIILQYYLAYIPMILVETSYIACLISVMVSFGGMTNANELIAMRSSGLSFWQITRPALCFGLMISMLVFWINERFVPESYQTTREIKQENMMIQSDVKRRKREAVKNLTFYGLNNRLFYVSHMDPGTNELFGITIIEYDDNARIKQKIVALKGKWANPVWKFYTCNITTYGEAGISQPLKVKVYKEKLMDIKEDPEDFLRQRVKVSSMNLKELSEYIDRFSSSGATRAINNLRVDLHQKMAFPWQNFVVIFLGLPFALMTKSRKGMTFLSVFIAMAVSFAYYVLSAVFLAFGKGGLLPPVMAAWIPPALFLGTGLIVIEYNFGR